MGWGRGIVFYVRFTQGRRVCAGTPEVAASAALRGFAALRETNTTQIHAGITPRREGCLSAALRETTTPLQQNIPDNMPARTEDPAYLKLSQIVIGLVAFFYALYVGREVILPLLYAIIFAILLNSAVEFLCAKGINRVLAIALTLVLALGLAFGLIYFIVSQILNFADAFPMLRDRFVTLSRDILSWASGSFGIRTTMINTWLDTAKEQTMSNSPQMIGRTIGSITGAFVLIFLMPIYIFMVLFYKPLLLDFISRLFPRERHETIAEVLTETKLLTQSYLLGLMVEMVIIAALNSAALLLLGIQYAVLLGIIGALLNLIPYIGGLIAISLPVLMALATKEPVYALYIIGVYSLIQLIDNNFIVPKIVASKVRINALVSIVVVLAGGALWGVAGMFLSIPLTAIVKVIFDRVEPLKPFGFLLGDTMPPMGKNFFQIKKRRKKSEATA